MRHIDLEAEQTFDRVEKSQLKRKTKTEEREKGRKREKLERREREQVVEVVVALGGISNKMKVKKQLKTANCKLTLKCVSSVIFFL